MSQKPFFVAEDFHKAHVKIDQLHAALVNLVVACEKGGCLEAPLLDARAALRGSETEGEGK